MVRAQMYIPNVGITQTLSNLIHVDPHAVTLPFYLKTLQVGPTTLPPPHRSVFAAIQDQGRPQWRGQLVCQPEQ